MSQYRDNQPQYSGRSPSPAFYAAQSRYDAYQDPDEELNYPVDDIGYAYDYSPGHYGRNRSVSPRPRSAGHMPPSMRQTPSPLRWAMQDLMDSLDTMSPQAPLAPRNSHHDEVIYRYQPLYDTRGYATNTWEQPEPFDEEHARAHYSDEIVPPFMSPVDMRPAALVNYIDNVQSNLDRVENYHYSPQRDADRAERSPSRISNLNATRPRSPQSVDKPRSTSPSFQPPMPPPHIHRHPETESVTSHSTKHSVFSAASSDYSTAPSSMSTGSAGSAGSFARKKHQLQRQEQETNRRTALSVVLPKSNSNAPALKGRKSYGSSLKKTIGKLLSTSPTKPPPGTVTDHGDKIIEWQNVRRDVNRANTPSTQERTEHRERLEMSEGIQVIRPIELLERIIEGDESANGSPILPDETFDISSATPEVNNLLIVAGVNFSLIDRATRLINQIPPQYLSSPASFAKSVICRPYASEIQRLRAIFVFLSEKFTWEPLHGNEGIDRGRSPASLQRLFETRRGTAEDIAWCFWEMCQGCNIHAEVIPGHLKCKILPPHQHCF